MTTQTSVFLELGQIIKINATGNDKLHEKIFFIDYLDEEKIRLLDINDSSLTEININDKQLSEETIEEIIILETPEEKGYARLHDLLPNNWISIEFGGDIPMIINGQITNLEEDTIEIKTYPDNNTIYIDFEYKGIPKNLPIIGFKSFKPPVQKKDEISDEIKTSEPETKIIDDELETKTSDDETQDEELFLDDLGEELENELEIPDISDKLKEILVDSNEIIFGDTLEEIEEESNIDDKYKRYGIESQTNDMLDEFLANVPTESRTSTVKRNIHLLIERFKELRKEYSNFDEQGNPDKPIIIDNNHKPIIDNFFNFKKDLKWIIPLVKNRKKYMMLKWNIKKILNH